MNCRDATALIEKLVDGEASESERSRAETHLGSCEVCRAEKRFLERTAEVMKARAETVSDQDAPADYWESLPERVLARIDEEKAPKKGGLRRAYPMMALAASLVIAVTVVLLTSRERGGGSLEVLTSQSSAPRAADATEEQPALEDTEDIDDIEDRVAEATEARSTTPDAGADETLSAESLEELRNLGYSADGAPAQPSERTEAYLRASRSRLETERESEDRAVAAAELEQAEIAPEPAEPLQDETSEVTAGADAPAPPPAAAPASSSLTRDMARSMSVAAPSPCETLRAELSRLPENAEAERTQMLYEIAQCSVQRYDTIGTLPLKELAVSDIESFLAVESDTERARELQQALTRLQ